MFKRWTDPQRDVLQALRALGGEMTVTPDTARPLHNLKRRGLVKFSRDESGVKVARLRAHAQRQRGGSATGLDPVEVFRAHFAVAAFLRGESA